MKEMRQDRIALDRALVTARTFDADGHMHVADTAISKATVNPYKGAEIPGWKDLGLDPSRIYQLLRDPKELENSADSFNGKPLLFVHKAMGSADHDHSIVVGASNNHYWDAPYLKAKSLTLWTDEAKQAVDSGEQRELSAAYRYRPDMTPGVYEGQKYDGVMREISGSHIALVKEGRAGSDVMVADSIEGMPPVNKIKLSRMASTAHGALLAHIAPMLAQDAKLDLTPVFKDVTAKNFKASKGKIAADVLKLAKPKLAKDEGMDLTAVAAVIEAVAEAMPDGANPVSADMDDDPGAMDDDTEMMAKLKGLGFSDEQCAKIMAMKGGDEPAAADTDDDDEKKKLAAALTAKDTEVKAKDAEMKDMVKKPAMDAAIKAAVDTVKKDQVAIREAEKAVRPYVGELAIAMDSADAVYRAALGVLEVEDADKLPAAALQPVFKQVVASREAAKKPAPRVAMDAKAEKNFEERFGTARIGHAA